MGHKKEAEAVKVSKPKINDGGHVLIKRFSKKCTERNRKATQSKKAIYHLVLSLSSSSSPLPYSLLPPDPGPLAPPLSSPAC